MNLTKTFVGGLGQYMCRAAHHSGGVDSSNPYHWSGKRLHHHGGDVCCVLVFSLFWLLSLVCKKIPEHNLKVRISPYYKVNRCYALTHIGMHHTPGKPVQAGRVVGQVDPACACQVRQGTPCNGAAAAITAVIWQGGQRPLHKCQKQPHRVSARSLPGVESPPVVRPAPPRQSRGWQRQQR